MVNVESMTFMGGISNSHSFNNIFNWSFDCINRKLKRKLSLANKLRDLTINLRLKPESGK